MVLLMKFFFFLISYVFFKKEIFHKQLNIDYLIYLFIFFFCLLIKCFPSIYACSISHALEFHLHFSSVHRNTFLEALIKKNDQAFVTDTVSGSPPYQSRREEVQEGRALLALVYNREKINSKKQTSSLFLFFYFQRQRTSGLLRIPSCIFLTILFRLNFHQMISAEVTKSALVQTM